MKEQLKSAYLPLRCSDRGDDFIHNTGFSEAEEMTVEKISI